MNGHRRAIVKLNKNILKTAYRDTLNESLQRSKSKSEVFFENESVLIEKLSKKVRPSHLGLSPIAISS